MSAAPSNEPRFFTIEVADATYSSGALRGKRVESIGRYASSNPLSAARKAATRLYGETGLAKVTFILRETTRGSAHGHFVYVGEKRKLAKPVTYSRKTKKPDGKVVEESIVKTHENDVKAVRGESDLRAFYRKVGLPFPQDLISDAVAKKSSKKSSKPASKPASKPNSKPASSGGARRRARGGALADTAAPLGGDVYSGDYTGEFYEGGGTTSCCQAASVTDPTTIFGSSGEMPGGSEGNQAALQAARQAALYDA